MHSHPKSSFDARVSSPELFAALAPGLAEAGADVDDVGLCTTPTTYWLCPERGYAAAVMITASHNAKENNGLKISRKGALPVGGDSGLKELEAMIAGGLPPKAAKPGAVRSLDCALDDYVRFQSLFAVVASRSKRSQIPYFARSGNDF